MITIWWLTATWFLIFAQKFISIKIHHYVVWCLAYVIRIAWCARWRIFLVFFFWRNSDHERTFISPWQWDTKPAVSFSSSFYYHFPLRIAQHADRAIICNKQWLVLILSRMSAAGKSVLPVTKWCASVRTSTGCICGQLARTTSSLLFGRSQVCCTHF